MPQGKPRPMAPMMPSIRVLSNKIVHARCDHLLECNCIIRKGEPYHRVVALVNNRFNYHKGHAGACFKLEVLH